MKKALALAAALSFSASAVLAEGPVVLADEGQLTKSTQAAGAVGSLGGAVGGIAIGTAVAVVAGIAVVATVVGGSGT